MSTFGARHRERRTASTIEWSNRYDYSIGSCSNPTASFIVGTPSTGTAETESKQEVMDDVVTPRFKKCVALGQIVNNPLEKVTTILKDTMVEINLGHQRSVYTNCSGQWKWITVKDQLVGTRPASGFYTFGVLPDVPDPCDYDSLIDLAITSAHARVNVSEAMAIVGLAEGQKTISSIASILKRLVGLTKNIVRLNIPGIAKELTPKELANRYMEARYAIRPLMYDLKSYVDAYSNASTIGKRLTFRGSERDGDSESSTSTIYETQGSGGYTIHREYYVTYSMERTVAVRSGVLTAIENLNPLQIWGFDDVLESLWELVPLSFVIDWFINVGQKIAAHTPECGLRTLASWYTLEERIYQAKTLSGTNIYLSGSPSNERMDDYYLAASGMISREIITKRRVPNPPMNLLPSWKLRMNMFKVADLTIILKQLASKLR